MSKKINGYLHRETTPILESEKYIIQNLLQTVVAVHDHAFLELSYIVRGSVKHTLDGQATVLNAGDYIIVDYGSLHSYHNINKDGFENIDFLFLPEFLDSVLDADMNLHSVLEHNLLHFNTDAFSENPARTVFHDADGEILNILKKVIKEDKKRKSGYSEMIRSYLIQILLITTRKLLEDYESSSWHNTTLYIVSYIAEHYKESITLNDLANKLNYSIPYISKQFKQDTGVTFVNYLQKYRVREACRLLVTTRLTIPEITEMVGYNDEKFFASLIKRTTGYYPSAFRKLKLSLTEHY